MRVKCKNCAPLEGIEVPHLSPSEKNKITKLVRQSPLHAIKYIKEHHKLGLVVAKYIAIHVTTINNHCNHCNFDKLEGEYINCPKCEALNFNWEIEHP